ncbi:MAG TPA: hypothetical protein VL403_10025 [Candidatus Kryptonia bacterium]|nr:hypothetical protein [Candidatus Kryptonia bacterium]
MKGQTPAIPEGFDSRLATAPIMTVPIDAVVDLLRVTHAPGRVQQYRDAMQQGERFPPIAVVSVGGRFFIADGHKRFCAYRSLPVDRIVVEVWTIRRLLRDLWRQFRKQTHRQWTLARRSLSDSGARAEARRLLADTARHWKRIFRSLASRRVRRGH